MPRKLNTEEFIRLAKLKHGDLYSYEKVNYKSSVTKVIITCRTHGDFEQEASSHLVGHGCKKCASIALWDTRGRITTEDFIIKAIKRHGSTYDYSKTKYIKAKSKVTIICSIHGEFEQKPDDHLHSKGCVLCSNYGLSSQRKGIYNLLTTEDFIIKAIKRHGSTYDYSKTKYINSDSKVTIICSIHGEFEQRASHHIAESGCPKCGYLKSAGVYSYEYFLNHPEKKDVPANVYLFKLDSPSESYYKIGISTQVQERYKRIARDTKSHITPIILYETTLFKAYSMEQEILQLYPSFIPSINFGGITECLTLTESDIKEIQCNIINT